MTIILLMAVTLISCAPSHEEVNSFQHQQAEYYVLHIDEAMSENKLKEIMNLYIDPSDQMTRYFFFYNKTKKDASVFGQDYTYDELVNTLIKSPPHHSYIYHFVDDSFEKNGMKYLELAKNSVN